MILKTAEYSACIEEQAISLTDSEAQRAERLLGPDEECSLLHSLLPRQKFVQMDALVI